MSGSGMVWVIIGSISILPSMYQSTIFGTSVRPRAPPKAVPFQTRPVTSWNGAGCGLRAGWGDADDDGLPPAAMARLERLAHHRDVAGAVEGIIGTADLVGAALGHVGEVGDEIAANLFGIDEVGHAEAFAPLLLAIVDVDAHNYISACKPQPLDDIEADAA
jgi:hypothetical protein